MTMLNFDWLKKTFINSYSTHFIILKFRQTVVLSTVQLLSILLELKNLKQKKSVFTEPALRIALSKNLQLKAFIRKDIATITLSSYNIVLGTSTYIAASKKIKKEEANNKKRVII